MIHTTRGSHPIRSIHLLKHSLDPWERHNPNRNALRSVEIQFLNHLRKETGRSKGCVSRRGWHWLRHSPWWHAHAEMDFCCLISTSNTLRISTGLEFAVPRTGPTNSLCHLYIYIYYCYIKFCSSRHFAFLRKCAFGAKMGIHFRKSYIDFVKKIPICSKPHFTKLGKRRDLGSFRLNMSTLSEIPILSRQNSNRFEDQIPILSRTYCSRHCFFDG